MLSFIARAITPGILPLILSVLPSAHFLVPFTGTFSAPEHDFGHGFLARNIDPGPVVFNFSSRASGGFIHLNAERVHQPLPSIYYSLVTANYSMECCGNPVPLAQQPPPCRTMVLHYNVSMPLSPHTGKDGASPT